MSLRGIGAGFVERVHLVEVSANRRIAQTAKPDARDFIKTCRSCAGEMTDEHSRTDFVSASAQAAQNRGRFIDIPGFPNDLIIERNQRIAREHDFSRMRARNRYRLAHRVEDGELAQGKIDIELFRDIRRDGRKFKTGGGE